MDEFREILTLFLGGSAATSVTPKDCGCFPPQVIFIRIVVTEASKEFHDRLQRFCCQALPLPTADYCALPFHSDLTIAFRNLWGVAFKNAWKHFQHTPFQHTSLADQLVLLRHEESHRAIFQKFLLPSP